MLNSTSFWPTLTILAASSVGSAAASQPGAILHHPDTRVQVVSSQSAEFIGVATGRIIIVCNISTEPDAIGLADEHLADDEQGNAKAQMTRGQCVTLDGDKRPRLAAQAGKTWRALLIVSFKHESKK